MRNSILYFLILVFSSLPANASSDDPWTWDEKRWGEITEQQWDNSCGLAALHTIIWYHFGDTRFDERALLQKYLEDTSEEALVEAMKNGISIVGLQQLAVSIGYQTTPDIKLLELPDLEEIVMNYKLPVLVYVEIGKLKHFSVVVGIKDGIVSLADSSRGNIEQTYDEFMSEWKAPKGFPPGAGGALILVRDTIGEDGNKLLKNPRPEPPSFKEMRRQMTVGRL